MSMTVKCSGCGRSYRVGDSKAGKKMKCQACGTVVAIPDHEILEDEVFLDDEAEFESLDDFEDVRPRPRRKGRTGKAKPAAPTGLRSPKVQYIGGGAIIALAVVVVLVVLYQRGYLGAKDDVEQDGVASNSKVEYELKTYGIGFEGEVQVSRDAAGRYPATYSLMVEKDGMLIGLKRDGYVTGKFERTDLQQDGAGAGFDRGDWSEQRIKSRPPKMGEAAEQAEERNRLKRIARAVFDYYKKHDSYPAPYIKGEGLSWRVHLLPYLGENELYQQFKLNEPWDSPHNKSLIAKMPDVFKTATATSPGTTTMHVFVGPETPFGVPRSSAGKATYQCRATYTIDPDRITPGSTYEFKLEIWNGSVGEGKRTVQSKRFLGSDLQQHGDLSWKFDIPFLDDNFRAPTLRDMLDGISNVVQCVVAGEETAAAWTKPGGLKFEPRRPFASMGTISSSGFSALMFDGRVVTVPADVHPTLFANVVQHQDGARIEHFPPPPGRGMRGPGRPRR